MISRAAVRPLPAVSPRARAALLFALLASLFVCLVSQPAFGQRVRSAGKDKRPSRDQQRHLDTTVTVDRGTILDLSASSAKITVRGWERSTMEVHAESDLGELNFSHTAKRVRLEIAAASRPNDNDGAIEVRAPKGTRVVINSRQGDAEVFDVGGELDVTIIAGNVDARGVVGRTSISIASGDMSLSDVEGPVRIDAISGDITLTNVRGDVEVGATSGTVVMKTMRANHANVSVVSGEITYDGLFAQNGRYEFNTHAGDVRLFVPANGKGTLNVQSFSGQLHSDIPLSAVGGETSGAMRNSLRGIRDSGLRRGQHLQFGGGSPGDGAEITISTFNGEVHIARGPRRSN